MDLFSSVFCYIADLNWYLFIIKIFTFVRCGCVNFYFFSCWITAQCQSLTWSNADCQLDLHKHTCVYNCQTEMLGANFIDAITLIYMIHVTLNIIIYLLEKNCWYIWTPVIVHLSYCPLVSSGSISNVWFLIKFESLMAQEFHVKLRWGECHRTPLTISQHWCSFCLVTRQCLKNVNLYLQCHMVLPGHNELKEFSGEGKNVPTSMCHC